MDVLDCIEMIGRFVELVRSGDQGNSNLVYICTI
jgi:hypothetical protein